MKKSLVALAALAATAAFAQSSVTITGIVDAGYLATTQPGDYKTNYIGQSGARTTTFKFIGTEDLGGGTSANFQFEVQPSIIAGNGNASGLNSVTSNAPLTTTVSTATSVAANPSGLVGKGESFVGLKDAALGEIRLGTINTNTFKTYQAVSFLGTGIGSGYANTGYIIPNITRLESAVAYDTPVWNGLSAGLVKGFGNDQVYGAVASGSLIIPQRNKVLDYAVTYANGPLAVKYANYATTKSGFATSTPGVTTTTKLLGGSYDAGVAKFGLSTGSIKSDDQATSAKVRIAAVTVPFMGSYRFIAQNTVVTYDLGAGSGIAGDQNKSTGLGLEKDLSKRTFVYLRNENANVAATAASAWAANGAALTSWNSSSPKFNLTMNGVSHQF